MKTPIKLIFLVFIVAIGFLALPLILMVFKINIEPFSIYISTIANIIVIFLMLLTILLTENYSRENMEALEKATQEQIESAEKWQLIKRKQFIQALIKELIHNVSIYEVLQSQMKTENFSSKPHFENFILTSVEKSLSASPIDDDNINHNLLVLYYIMKIDDNKINATRIPKITKESINGLLNSIVSIFEENKGLYEITIEMLRNYEHNLEISK